MNYLTSELDAAIAVAMGETLGTAYTVEGSPNQRRFIDWGKQQLSVAERETYENLRSICSEQISIMSALRIMDRVDWNSALDKLELVQRAKVSAVQESGPTSAWSIQDMDGNTIARVAGSDVAGAWANRIATALNLQMDS